MGKRRDEIIERAERVPEIRFLADGCPLILKGQGARLFDIDNVGYIDYTGGGGSAIAGFANQYISDAVKKALTNGVPAGFHPPIEVDLAETLGQFLPWVEAWYFVRDETEAFHRALNWARKRTGRSQFLLFGSGREAELSAYGESCRVIPGWGLDLFEAALTGGAPKIAAVVVDPVMSGCGVIPAPNDVLARLAELCRNVSIPLIFDERVTGFRVARGGAAELAGVVPDAVVFGGALGGGFPIGAFGVGASAGETTASDENGENVDGAPPHPAAMRASEAVLSILKNDAVFERLEERSAQLVEGMNALAERFSRPLMINRVGSIFALYPSREEVSGKAQSEAADGAAYERLVSALREEGILLPPSIGVPAFVSSAHGAKDIEETVTAFEKVLLRLHQEDLP